MGYGQASANRKYREVFDVSDEVAGTEESLEVGNDVIGEAMQLWAQKQEPETHVGSSVRTTRTIYQAPRSTDPNVPRGTVGSIEDYDWINRRRGEVVFAVDFGDPYGVVIVSPDEITLL